MLSSSKDCINSVYTGGKGSLETRCIFRNGLLPFQMKFFKLIFELSETLNFVQSSGKLLEKKLNRAFHFRSRLLVYLFIKKFGCHQLTFDADHCKRQWRPNNFSFFAMTRSIGIVGKYDVCSTRFSSKTKALSIIRLHFLIWSISNCACESEENGASYIKLFS